MLTNCDHCNSVFNKAPFFLKRNKFHFCSRKCQGNFLKQKTINKILSKKYFKNWEVLWHNGFYKDGSPKFDCKCKCGRIKNIIGSSLLQENSSKCKNCSKRLYEDKISGHLYSRIRHKAHKRNIKFCVDKKYLSDLLIKQQYKCYYSNITIYIPDTQYEQVHGKITASLDRIDSSKGYEENNVCWVHKDINSMKWDLCEKDFLYWCYKVSNFDHNFPIFTRNININIDKRSKGYKEISGSYYYSLYASARKRKILFDITIEDIWAQYLKQGGLCFLSGININFDSSLSKNYKNGINVQDASVDRIDSSKGYILSNIQILHKNINIMKLNMEQNKFINWCQTITKYRE